jgi:DNA polymerase III delta prime subunit
MNSYKEQCAHMIQKGTLIGTFLFTGPNGEEKSRFCQDLAGRLLGSVEKIEKGNHPDLHVFHPEGKSGMHAQSALKGLIDAMSLPPYEAPSKVFIIHDAERMLPAGSNALLKTLEEPRPDALIILLSKEPHQLLPTIVSRCRIVRFDFEWNPTPNAQLTALLSDKTDYPSLLKSLDALEASLTEEEESPERMKQMDALYEQILYWYRDRHLLAAGGPLDQLYHDLGALQRATKLSLPPLERVFTQVEASRLASQRYVRLRHAIESLL